MRRVHRYLIFLPLVLAACATPTVSGVVGTWGGESASMVLEPGGGQVTYLCGSGTVDPGWTVTPDGTFIATGVFYFGGGPAPSQGRTPHPATYLGHIQGDAMTLTVTVPDSNLTLGPYKLMRNGPLVTEACV
jgi:hypothetical protein